MPQLLLNISKPVTRNVIPFAAIGMGIGVLTPFCTTGVPLAVELILTEWILFTKISIVVLGVFCVFPLIYSFFKFGNDKLEFFSPAIIFPLLYFTVFGLGSLGLLAKDDHRVIVVLLCAVSGIIFYYLGVLFTHHAMNFIEHRKKVTRPYTFEWNPYLLKVLIFFFLLVSLLATIYHALKIGLPIFAPNVEEVRIKIQQEVSNYIIFLMRLITPAFFFLLAYGLGHRNVKRITLVFFFLAGISLLLTLANRHDIFTFVIGSVVIYNFAGKKIKFSKLIGVLLIGLIFLMSIGFYRLANMSYVNPEKALLMRITNSNPILMFPAYSIFQFTVYPSNFSVYLDTFPKILPFEWGYSFVRAVSTILPGHQDLLDEYVKSALKLQFLGGGINPTLLGELYANFGYTGLIGMTFYGAGITLLFHKMLKHRKAIHVLLYAYGLNWLLLSTINGIFSYFLYFYYIVAIVFMHLVAKRKAVELNL